MTHIDMIAQAQPRRKRSRPWGPLAVLTVGLALVLKSQQTGVAAAKAKSKPKPNVLPLTAAILQDNMEHWTHDYAVYFYASWCPYCKKFAPYWDEIAAILVGKKSKDNTLVVGKLNCEDSTAAMDFCTSIGVTHYPTVMYFGAGDYHDNGLFASLFSRGGATSKSRAKYKGPLVPDYILDWAKTMRWISKFNRIEDRVKRALGLKRQPDHGPAVQKVKEENRALKEQNSYLSSLVKDAYGGDALNKGGELTDPYAGLHQVDYAAEYGPLIWCTADQAAQYCETVEEGEEPYCATLEECLLKEFKPEKCRPKKCPFGPRGCDAVSVCLEADVLRQYVELWNDTLKEQDALLEEQATSSQKAGATGATGTKAMDDLDLANGLGAAAEVLQAA